MDALLKKILKPGAILTVIVYDPNDPEILKDIRDCQERQQKILDSKGVRFPYWL